MAANIPAIHPRLDGKYSKNLYQWLTLGNRPSHRSANVFTHEQDGALWIGIALDDSFIGKKLTTVLTEGGKADSFAFPGMQNYLTPVPDFWSKYAEIGRCAIDKDHSMSFPDDELRWQYTNKNLRSCKWCGQAHQEMQHITRTITEEKWCATAGIDPTLPLESLIR